MHLIGTLMLLLKGAIDFETRKHDLVVKCTTSLFFVLYGKAEMVSSSLPACGWAAFIPTRSRVGMKAAVW